MFFHPILLSKLLSFALFSRVIWFSVRSCVLLRLSLLFVPLVEVVVAHFMNT